jgi:hypothetical protein
MQILIGITALLAALLFGGVVWCLDHPILYWVLYLAFFIVCGWPARGRFRKGGS